MRKFLISAAIVGLIGGTSLAMAQDHDRGNGPGGGDKQHMGGGDAQHTGGGGAPHAGPPAGEPHPASQAAPNPPAAGGRNAIGQRDIREHHDAPAATLAAPQTAAPNAVRGNNFSRDNNNPRDNVIRGNGPRPDSSRPNSNGSNFNNAMRDSGRQNGGQRHDFSSFRNFHQNFRTDRRFHAPIYRRPPGWYSHRWAWGEMLPITFWARDYWLTDFYDYDLPPPPFGAVWVRVGSDALLIDQDSGEIIEVDYGVFY